MCYRREDPMKLKAIFIKSEGAKKRKHLIRKEKKRAQKQSLQLTNPPPNQNKSSNPFENVFSGLV